MDSPSGKREITMKRTVKIIGHAIYLIVMALLFAFFLWAISRKARSGETQYVAGDGTTETYEATWVHNGPVWSPSAPTSTTLELAVARIDALEKRVGALEKRGARTISIRTGSGMWRTMPEKDWIERYLRTRALFSGERDGCLTTHGNTLTTSTLPSHARGVKRLVPPILIDGKNAP